MADFPKWAVLLVVLASAAHAHPVDQFVDDESVSWIIMLVEN